MKIFHVVITAITFPFGASADLPTRQPASLPHQVDKARIERQRQIAEKAYRRGVQFAEGDGVAQDYVEAVRFYLQAAEAGYAPAQYDLAYLYEKGLGLECDLKQAAMWYQKAADQGDPEAQNNLGTLYATGQGVPRSDSEAIRWYRLAAEENDPEGMTNLGMMYLQGRGVKRDFVRAFQLFRDAAEQDYAGAQNNLGLMYANGQAVTRDYVWAYAWLDLAAAQISGCTELRDRVSKNMTAATSRVHASWRCASARNLHKKERNPNDYQKVAIRDDGGWRGGGDCVRRRPSLQVAPSSIRVRCARTFYRRPDDANSSRQASPGVRGQFE